MRFIIHSPAGIQAESGNIDAIQTSLVDGKPLTILPRHAPLMAELGSTDIKTRAKDSVQTFAVKSGILIVHNDEVKVLTTGMREEQHA